MKRKMISMATAVAFASLAVAMSAPVSADTNTYFGFRIGIGSAPPPPQVVYTAPPPMDRWGGSRVTYLRDDPGYDMFHYRSWYYMNSDGNWYRSRSYRGHFRPCDVRKVPRQVLEVPADRWHHHPHGDGQQWMNGDHQGRSSDQDQGQWQGQDPRQQGDPGQRQDQGQWQGGNAEESTYLGFHIGVSNAPPAPRVVYNAPPRMERDSSSEVMFLNGDPGYDMFRYQSSYYVTNNGYWYRSEGYNGPYVVFDVRQVPQQVLDLPAERWHHHPQGGPPGQNGNQGWRRDSNQGQGSDHR